MKRRVSRWLICYLKYELSNKELITKTDKEEFLDHILIYLVDLIYQYELFKDYLNSYDELLFDHTKIAFDELIDVYNEIDLNDLFKRINNKFIF